MWMNAHRLTSCRFLVRGWLLAAAVVLGWLAPAGAADLSRVDRTVGKQPKYAGKPAYCLLVFGPDAGHRVWLVRDGDVLYVDRNGNGDLTEPGEKVLADKDDTNRAFHVGRIRVGKLEHRNVTVRSSRLSSWGTDVTSHPVSRAALQKDKDVEVMNISAEIEVPGFTGEGDGGRLSVGARIDSGGPLLFAGTPASAPIVHLGGPLHLRTERARPTLYRNVVHDLMLSVGTPGHGPGTFASVGYDKLIPPEAFIVVEAEFPPGTPGGPVVKQRFELKHRC
jgi:hypothetical protein